MCFGDSFLGNEDLSVLEVSCLGNAGVATLGIDRGKNTTTIGSVEKALAILDTFSQNRQPLGVTEVSKILSLNFSTTHHLVSTLCAGGYLEQDPGTKKYRLGIKALQLGLAASESFTLIERARPVIRELAWRVNENVNLAVFDRFEAIYVDQAASARTVGMFIRLGARVPLYCTGVGKVYLASLSPEQVRAVLESQASTRFTANTIVEWRIMDQELAVIREKGYAVDREEREEGVACVAAPVHDLSGQVIAAISVSGPAGRILPREDVIAPETLRSARELSSQLGYDCNESDRRRPALS